MIEFCFQGKKALIRTDFNVPMINGSIEDPTKIMVSLPTINKVLNDGGKVTLISHFGRPEGRESSEFSMRLIYFFLKTIYKDDISFAKVEDNPNDFGTKIVLLENLRFYLGEESNDIEFAKKLAKWGDVYINDAFASLHRNHASLVQLPLLYQDKFLGISLQNEINNINQVIKTPKKPLVVAIGGGKVLDKISPLKNLIPNADTILLGGVVANTFLMAQEKNIGLSKYDEESIPFALEIMKLCEKHGTELLLPLDCVTLEGNSDSNSKEILPSLCNIENIQENQAILDIGPETIEVYTDAIDEASTFFWSGPMGMIENEVFSKGTKDIVKATLDLTKRGGIVLIGGGETGVISRKSQKNGGYISTGGSALLKYLEGKKLPAMWW